MKKFIQGAKILAAGVAAVYVASCAENPMASEQVGPGGNPGGFQCPPSAMILAKAAQGNFFNSEIIDSIPILDTVPIWRENIIGQEGAFNTISEAAARDSIIPVVNGWWAQSGASGKTSLPGYPMKAVEAFFFFEGPINSPEFYAARDAAAQAHNEHVSLRYVYGRNDGFGGFYPLAPIPTIANEDMTNPANQWLLSQNPERWLNANWAMMARGVNSVYFCHADSVWKTSREADLTYTDGTGGTRVDTVGYKPVYGLPPNEGDCINEFVAGDSSKYIKNCPTSIKDNPRVVPPGGNYGGCDPDFSRVEPIKAKGREFALRSGKNVRMNKAVAIGLRQKIRNG